MKGRRYYRERIAYMRSLARTAETAALKASCLKAAEDYEALLAAAEEEAAARTAISDDPGRRPDFF